MPFDLKRFEKAKFSDRVGEVALPALSGFFADGEDPVWKVRGLTHAELSTVAASVGATANIDALIKALSGDAKEKAEAIKNMLGFVDDSVPDETKKRINYLVIGSVMPAIELPIAVKLAENFPIEFSQLTNKIVELTGKGRVVNEVKRKPSGNA